MVLNILINSQEILSGGVKCKIKLNTHTIFKIILKSCVQIQDCPKSILNFYKIHMPVMSLHLLAVLLTLYRTTVTYNTL